MRGFLAVSLFLFAFAPLRTLGRVPDERSIAPSRCTGWQLAGNGAAIDLPASADWEQFSRMNAALYRFVPATPGSFGEGAPDTSLVCSGFSVGEGVGQELAIVSVVLSLAVLAPADGEDVLVPSFSLDDGVSWVTLQTVLARGITSNARHDGYWRLDLPQGIERRDLAHLQVRLHYATAEQFTPVTVFLDGLRLETTVAPAAKEQKGFWQQLFSAEEIPTIIVDEKSIDGIQVLDADGRVVDAPVLKDVGAEGTTIRITKGRGLKPGTYILRTTTKRFFRTTVEERAFAYGQISFNTSRSVYEPGDLVPLAFGAVDEQGKTVCDADLSVLLRKPDGTKKVLRTSDGSIVRSAECGAESLTNIPDYEATFLADQIGAYELTLSARTANGPAVMNRSITVTDERHAVIERAGPTRINPRVPYVMRLRITPTQDSKSEVVETLPVGFEVIGVTPPGEVRVADDGVTIHWPVELRASQTYDFSYTIDAPDISPAHFTLGPIQAGSEIERRSWTIASDEVVRKERGD
ncbi:MAG: hypothetical protein HY566_03055, partial [Candidatus Kerfeldbacteria bacterium]|nr:hypothetical protein [Candidatus Kerfeldbacteria bacterium]